MKEMVLQWVPYVDIDWQVFVEKSEYPDYCNNLNPVYIYPSEEDDIGLSGNLNEIQRYAYREGYTHVWKVDDDIKGMQPRKKIPVIETIPRIMKMLSEVRNVFESNASVAAIGFNYHHQMFQMGKWLSKHARLQTSYIVDVDYIDTPDEVSVLEDFYRYIRIRMDGKLSPRYGMLGIDCRAVGKGDGGHNLPGRRERVETAIEYIVEHYPFIEVKKVEGKDWDWEPDFAKTKW